MANFAKILKYGVRGSKPGVQRLPNSMLPEQPVAPSAPMKPVKPEKPKDPTLPKNLTETPFIIGSKATPQTRDGIRARNGLVSATQNNKDPSKVNTL